MDDNEEWSGVAAEATLARFNSWHEGVRGVLVITRHRVTWTAEETTNDSGYADGNGYGNGSRSITICMYNIETTKMARNNGTLQIFTNNDSDAGNEGPVSFTPLRKEDGKIARKLINKIANTSTPSSSPVKQQDYTNTNGSNSGNGNGNSASSQPRLRKHRRKLSKRRLSYRNANAVDPAEEAAELANFARKYTPPIRETSEETEYGGFGDHSRNSRDGYFNYNTYANGYNRNNDRAVARWKLEWRKITEKAEQVMESTVNMAINLIQNNEVGNVAKWWMTHSLDISVCVVAIFALIVTIVTLAMADVLTLRIRLLGVAVSSISR